MIEPRQEARPLKDNELTPDQRAALDKARTMLSHMAESRATAADPRPAELVVVDEERFNNVLLVDGGRGSGKTSVLLTLLKDLRTRYLNDPSAPHAFVPLETVDLDPLPPSANLLLYVLGRLVRVLDGLEHPPAPGEVTRAARRQRSTEPLESPRAWDDLARTVATGWNVDLLERSARISDLDQVAEDFNTSMRQGIEILRAFRGFMNRLVKDFENLWGQKPFFVLPIDDADMNPSRTADLMRLLHYSWHPRLAYVLTGDSNLFLLSLRYHYAGELRRPLGSGNEKLEFSGLREYMDLAGARYARVIPRRHRFRLDPLPRARRLDLKFGLDGTNLQLVEELKSVPVGAGSLLDRFNHCPQLLDALPSRLRMLIDVGFQLNDRLQDKKTAETVAQFLWEEAVETSDMAPADTDALRRIVQWDDRVEIDLRGVEIGHSEMDLRTARFAPFSFHEQRPLDVEVSLRRLDGNSVPVPARVTAALLLAIDVASRASNAYFVGGDERMAPVLMEVSFASARANNKRLQFSWPAPAWPSWVDHMHLGALWEQVATDRTMAREARFALFLKATLEVCGVPGVAPGEGGVDSQTYWNPIAKAIRDLASVLILEKTSEFMRASIEWAQRALLLCTPEIGFPTPGLRAALLSSESKDPQDLGFNAEPFSTMMERVAREKRRERVRGALAQVTEGEPEDAQIDAVLTELDAVTPPITRPTNSAVTLIAALGQLQVTLPADGFFGQHAGQVVTLHHYLTPARRRDLETLPPGVPERLADALGARLETVPLVLEHALRGAGLLVAGAYTLSPSASAIQVLLKDKLSRVEAKTSLNGLSAIAHDLQVDLADKSASGSSDLQAWPGTTFGWPTPPWPSLLDRELLATSWNAWFDGIEADILADSRGTLEILCYRYLQCVLNIAENRLADVGSWARVVLDGETWQQMVQRLLKKRTGTRDGARWAAFDLFLLGLPALAHPTSGLGEETRAAIGAALEPHSVK
jgi:hypothetical protein